ncbi:MAG: tetratricopeptide repeat protein, partial [Longimicrobiales bacterium]
IDLQFEEAGVFAPELDADERIESGGEIREFDLGAADLNSVFAPWAERDEAEVGVARAAEALEAARTALARGEYDRAATEAGRALAPGAARGEALLLLGDIFLRQGLAGEALERFLAARDEAASGGRGRQARATALLGVGRALALLARWEESAEAMVELLEANPDAGEARRLLGEAQLRSGDARAAATTLAKATSFASQDARVWTLLGEATLEAGDPVGAESAFRTALEVDPDATSPRLGLARLFIEGGRADEAASMLRKALNLLPSYGDAALALAALEMKRDRPRLAIDVLADLLTADPYHLDGLFLLGRALEQAGQREAAAVAFQRVLRLDPQRRHAAQALARLERTAV